MPQVHELGPLLGRLREMLERDGNVPAELVRAVEEKEAFAHTLAQGDSSDAAGAAEPASGAREAE